MLIASDINKLASTLKKYYSGKTGSQRNAIFLFSHCDIDGWKQAVNKHLGAKPRGRSAILGCISRHGINICKLVLSEILKDSKT